MHLILGFCAAVAVAVSARKMKALDWSGAIAAVITGAVVFAFGGAHATAALLGFFVSGSALSRLPGAREMPTGDESGGRSWKQVFANGSIPVLAILIGRIVPQSAWIAMPAYFAAIAVSTADSWATEIGTRYGKNVRDLFTRERITPGVSGGVSLPGVLASIAGATLIASLAFFPSPDPTLTISHIPSVLVFVAIVFAGFIGALADSALGSAMQAKYTCDICGEISEIPVHGSHPVTLISGFRIVTNNVVNFAASAMGAVLIWAFLQCGL